MNHISRFLLVAAIAFTFHSGLAAASSPIAAALQPLDAEGNTPLHLAVLRGDADAVEALLKAGADAAALNAAEATPLHYAAANERIVTALLAHGAPVNARSKLWITPLMSAVIRPDSIGAVRRLVAAGADVNYRIGDSDMILFNAIDGGDRRTVEFLLDHGAEANPTKGIVPITAAAFGGDVEIVKLLLAHGATVNCPDGPFQNQPLSMALLWNHHDVARLLIERGANVNARAPFPAGGETSLVMSAYDDTRDPAIARMLVERGADINSANDKGETALTFALKRGTDSPLVAFLREAGAKDSAPQRRKKAIPSRTVPAEPVAREAMLRASVQRAIDLIQPSSKVFLQTPMVRDMQKCTSCHQQALPGVAMGLARERGLRVDEHELGRSLHALVNELTDSMEQTRQARVSFTVRTGFDLDFLHAQQFAPGAVTEAVSLCLLSLQRPDGSWNAPVRRPPMEDGPLVATAWAARALQLYPPAGREHDAALALERARTWLAGQKLRDLNDRIFQLLGLAWTNETAERLRPLAEPLITAQSADGGWAQFPTLDGDAWATGSALVALHKAGIPATHPAYQRGVTFLLRTQFDDGSWWVRSRSLPTQPHWNGKFPHGKDQWISAAGTSWAMTALLLTLDPTVDTAKLMSAIELIAAFKASPPEKTAKDVVAAIEAKQPPAAAAGPIDFVRDVKPILERSCVGCHSGEQAKGSFSLVSRESLLKGGQSGEPAVVPGYAEDSQLIEYVSGKVEDLEMPPLDRRKKYPSLSAEEIERLHTWIDAGAPWPATPPAVKENVPAPTASTETPAIAASPGT